MASSAAPARAGPRGAPVPEEASREARVREVGLDSITVLVATAALLEGDGSPVSLETVAWLIMIAPPGAPALTRTVIVKADEALTARLGLEHATLPESPTTGVVQVQPAAADKDWKVVVRGAVSVSRAFAAALGPLLVTARV